MRSSEVDFALEERLAEHLATSTWEDLPPASRDNAVRALLWWLATGLEGATEPHQRDLCRYVAEQGGRPEASIIGSAQRAPAELAGLINGRAGKAWEHEDKYWVDESIGFAIGCCVVPAALATAEASGAVSGRDVATAIALAVDLEVRLIRPLGLGFVPGRSAANATFALGTYGAAAAAAKILRLDSKGFLDALGLAHCQASGNFQGQFEGRGVALQAGIAVRNGIAAARMAQTGLPGPRAWLTGACGLYAVHYPRSVVAFDSIVDGLGSAFLNIHQGFKGYPCGVVAHPVVDGVLAARASLTGRSIESISVFGTPSLGIMADPIERKRSPNTAIEAQFSIPWAAACAIRDGHLSIAHYEEQSLNDPELRRLAGTVSIYMSDDMQGTAVKIGLSDGTVIEPAAVFASKGNPKNPLSTDEIATVLRRAATHIGVTIGAVDRAVALVRGIETLDDLGSVLSLLTPHPHETAGPDQNAVCWNRSAA